VRELFATGKPRLNVEMMGDTAAQPDVKRTWLNSYFPLKNLNGEQLFLQDAGHLVETAHSGREAFVIARNLRPETRCSARRYRATLDGWLHDRTDDPARHRTQECLLDRNLGVRTG
jgi:hypothetical protein